MGLTDRLKDAAKKAEDAAAERKGQIREAVHKAGAVADEKTGGKYSAQSQKAGAKADSVVDRIKDPDAPGEGAPASPPPGPSGPAAAAPPPGPSGPAAAEPGASAVEE
jgi:hypothetical protein